jgi:PIN domain nuclease of toxin-antitoxin system
MNLLLDTNIFIWFIHEDNKLPAQYKMHLLNKENTLVVSVVSLWEISVKHSLGKLSLKSPIESLFFDVAHADFFSILPIEVEHLVKAATLPFHHRDPFDRLIYAQSVVEKLEFLYTDKIFDAYKNIS